jgi:hypothetical protein
MAPHTEIKVMKTVKYTRKWTELTDMVAAASDINLWKEWAAIEDALVKEKNIRYQKVCWNCIDSI